MAEEPHEHGGGGGLMSGPMGIAVLFFILFGGIYGIYARSAKMETGPTARQPSMQGFLEWLIPGYKAPQTSDQSGSTDEGQIKIGAVIPKTGTTPMQVIIMRSKTSPINLAGWMIRGSKGSQIIGLEGQNSFPEVKISILNNVVDPNHDRLILFDGQGNAIDQYVY